MSFAHPRLSDPDSSSPLHLWLALRLALRQFRRAPGVAFYAGLTLAIGLGAATAIYSVLRGFQAPLPVPDGPEVVQITLEDPEHGRDSISAADYRAWVETDNGIKNVAAFVTERASFSSTGKPTRLTSGALMSPTAFELLRISPLIGRLPSEETVDDRSVVISYRLWQERFERSSDAIGGVVRISGEPHTVIGVMPEGFNFPFQQEYWLTATVGDERLDSDLEVMARLHDDVSRAEAERALNLVLSRQRAETSDDPTARAYIYGFTEKRGDSSETTMLLGLLMMVVALVIVSCSNVSNLLLERAAARARSLAVHQALGAVPGQIVLQIFIEALVVALCGVVLGVMVAAGIVHFIERTLSGHWGYFWMEVTLDSAAVGFAALLGALTALVSGTLPAWRAKRTNIAEPLKQESKGGRSNAKPWASWILMTGQVAFSCAAVIASVLMSLGLLDSRTIVDTFPAASLAWTRVTFDGDQYASLEARTAYRQAVLTELEAEGVDNAALSTGMPALRTPRFKVTLGGRPVEDQTRPMFVSAVTPDFFDLFGLRVRDGRAFFESETGGDIAVVSEDFVRLHLEGERAIGRTLDIHRQGQVDTVRIVGVVSDVVIYRSDRERRLDHVYVPIAQHDVEQLYLTARGGGELTDAISRAAFRANPDVAIDEVLSMTEILAYLRQFSETLGTLAILGGLGAMVVVAIGLYGLISFDIRRRLPEFALRLALGAGTRRVVLGVVRRGFVLILPGLILGLGFTYLVTPLLGVFLGSADSHDPRVFFGALSIYALIALLATIFPARRAAYCNPVEVLREE